MRAAPICIFAMSILVGSGVPLGSTLVLAESYEEVLEALKTVSLDEASLRKLAGKDRFKPYALNPVVSPGLGTQGAWDAGALGTACVVKVDGLYHMYYEAWGALTHEGGKEQYDSLQIGHAVSFDGVHWAKDPANPVVCAGGQGDWNEHGTWVPFVIHEEGQFKMWFGGSEGHRCEWAYATSRDGRTFDVQGPISELGEVEDIHVVHDLDRSEYRAYYWNRAQAPWNEVMAGPPGQPSGLFVARSKNATDFDFENAQRIEIADQVWPPKYSHVLPYRGRWAMIYGTAATRGNPSHTGLAFSDDGIQWSKSAFPLVFGHDAELIEAAPNLWLMIYGPDQHFDWPECDLRLAIYEGALEDLEGLTDPVPPLIHELNE